MSQNSLVLPTTGTLTGLTMVQDINGALDTLNTCASGGSAPASPADCQLWADTTNSLLKQWDATNAVWRIVGILRSDSVGFSHGSCRLVYTSATQLTLLPYNGNGLIINGLPQRIPAGGVALANTGLTASTFYYVYAYMSGSTMALEASATGHTTGTNGIEVKSTDSTRTLVGAALTTGNTPGQFADSGSSARYTLSWFNKKKIILALAGTVGGFTNTGAVSELDPTKRLFFINWTGEGIKLNLSGQYTNTATGDVVLVGNLDGTSITNQSGGSIVNGGNTGSFACGTEINSTEGVGHTLQLWGRVSTGTGSLSGLTMSVSTNG